MFCSEHYPNCQAQIRYGLENNLIVIWFVVVWPFAIPSYGPKNIVFELKVLQLRRKFMEKSIFLIKAILFCIATTTPKHEVPEKNAILKTYFLLKQLILYL